jgi:hypothetical protein
VLLHEFFLRFSLTRTSLSSSPLRMLKPLFLAASFALITIWPLSSAWSQMSVVTYDYDNARTGQDISETMLTPANVNSSMFGLRFTQPVDGFIVGQPLYLPNVEIPNNGTHNVVYVATMNDSVYAFDADSNTGSNSAPLWQINFLNPAAGVTTATGSNLPCTSSTGYTQEGIVSTGVIDPNAGLLFVVAKTLENGVVVHRLHALNVTTGVEEAGSPVELTGSFTAIDGTTVTFDPLHAMNRPALLLNNGTLFIAFGSNGCNDAAHGWVFSYNEATLAQIAIYNSSPDEGETNQNAADGPASIWLTGSGPAADEQGNVYLSTGEGKFTANTGGQDFGSSVIKLTPGVGTLFESDYFTPWNQLYLSQNDLDLSSSGPVVLPDQTGSTPDELIASGKEGVVYVLNRDNMGQYNPAGDTQIIQEISGVVGGMFGKPVYWNNTVYFAGNGKPIHAYTLSGGTLTTPPLAGTVAVDGGHSPTVSANGTTNGVIWLQNGTGMQAFNAQNLSQIYSTTQAGTRDTLLPRAHFDTQTVANGKVYVGTQTNLMVYGLLPALATVSGNSQSSTVKTSLPLALQAQLVDPYTDQPVSGVTVTFSDGDKGGTFGSPSAVTDASGYVSTTYTFGSVARTVTITASNEDVASTTFTETAVPSTPKWVVLYSGGKQSAPVSTVLPDPIVVKDSDQYGNGISGAVITFSDGGAGGSFSANPVTTNSSGEATTSYTTPSTAGAITITATTPGLNPLKIPETVTGGSIIKVQ